MAKKQNTTPPRKVSKNEGIPPIKFVSSEHRGANKEETERQTREAKFKAEREAKQEAENGETPKTKAEEKKLPDVVVDILSRADLQYAMICEARVARSGKGGKTKKKNTWVKGLHKAALLARTDPELHDLVDEYFYKIKQDIAPPATN